MAQKYKETLQYAIPEIETKYSTKLSEPRTVHLQKEILAMNLILSKKALRLVMETMNTENGFSRHDGSNYYVHCVDVAQSAIDYGLVEMLISQGQHEKADCLVASCLLHDIVEDVKGIDRKYLEKAFNYEIAEIVLNVTKIEDETYSEYIERWSSNEFSALVKVLDRMNNVGTLNLASHKHRKYQVKETREIFIPVIKHLRRRYWEYNRFYFLIRSTMNMVLQEIEREIELVDTQKNNG